MQASEDDTTTTTTTSSGGVAAPAPPPVEGKTKEEESTAAPPPPQKMKAVVLAGFGGLKMVRLQQKPQPSPAEGEVLVHVKACGINFLDLMVRQGVIDSAPKTPVIMGFECAGVVEAIGENTTGFNVGDNVIALNEYNMWAEFAAVPSRYVYKMPEGMTFQEGAAFAMNFLTAYIMLFDIANLREGQSVLAHSIGGGVGQALIQLCKTVENVTLYGTASASKQVILKEKVAHLFTHEMDYVQEIRKLAPEGVDIVLDCLCGDDTNKGIGLLKPMGRYILYGTSNVITGETKSFFSFAKSWWQVDKISPIKLHDDNKFIAGFQLRQLMFRDDHHNYVRNVMNKLFQLYTAGIIKPVIDQQIAFEDVGEAMQKLHDRKNIGKIIIDSSLQPAQNEQTEALRESTSEDKEKEGAGNGD